MAVVAVVGRVVIVIVIESGKVSMWTAREEVVGLESVLRG